MVCVAVPSPGMSQRPRKSKFAVMSLPRQGALPTNPEVPRLNQSWPEFPRSFVLDESGFCVSSEPGLVYDPKLLQLA